VMLLNRASQKRSPELEGLIKALIDKIERGELARRAHSPLGRLAERKVKPAMEIERDEMRETLIDLEHDVARAKNLARLLHMVVEHFADERDMLAISQLAGDLDETLETIEDARVSMIGALAPLEQTEQAAA
jgi:endonuclease III